jgi:hypothetical protein
MPARFCVVASDHAAAIATVARRFAELDPNGRVVLCPGDPDYPAEIVERAIAGVANPGAVVLTPDGGVFDVLNVDDARNGMIITDVFSRAVLA